HRLRRSRRRRPRDNGADSSPRVLPLEQQIKELEPACPLPPATDFDLAYFQSYSHLGIHEEMIKDRVRTEMYRDAIFHHRDLIAGKVVVDVGCGTGILSIFCAQAGAKRVYAIDASNIAVQAMEVIRVNNLSEIVVVLHGRVEDVEISEKVDVIVSEWMGYMLFYESMLESVIVARERWLKPGGLILPSHATLYMAPISNPERYGASVDFWRDVYGIDMSVMIPLAKQCAFEEPAVESVGAENVLTWPHVVKHIDCSTVSIQELFSISTGFKFTSMMRAPFNGFAFWFDVEFCAQARDDAEVNRRSTSTGGRKRNADLVLSTAPEHPLTHWEQTVVYLYEPIMMEQDSVIEGSASLTQSKENRRFMNIRIEYSSNGRSFVKEAVLR
ncbi:hypothetical protein M569_07221, partial [Genlisea aurea]